MLRAACNHETLETMYVSPNEKQNVVCQQSEHYYQVKITLLRLSNNRKSDYNEILKYKAKAVCIQCVYNYAK